MIITAQYLGQNRPLQTYYSNFKEPKETDKIAMHKTSHIGGKPFNTNPSTFVKCKIQGQFID